MTYEALASETRHEQRVRELLDRIASQGKLISSLVEALADSTAPATEPARKATSSDTHAAGADEHDGNGRAAGASRS